MGEGGHALFHTAIGVCGIAWASGGIVAVQLPEADEASTRRRLVRELPSSQEVAVPPAQVQAAIQGVQALLGGEARDLREVALDMTRLTPFQRDVYAIARAIAPGQTMTYGEVARALGDPGLARAVGQALGHNPFAPIVPCHRVLAAGARAGGFSAGGGVATKLRMLQIERARFGDAPGLFDGAPA